MNASQFFTTTGRNFMFWCLDIVICPNNSPKENFMAEPRAIGASVRLMQKQLTLLSYNTFGIDGKFGFNSKKALIDFQKDIKQTLTDIRIVRFLKIAFSTSPYESRHFLSPSPRRNISPSCSCIKPIMFFRHHVRFMFFAASNSIVLVISSSEKDQTAFTSI